MPRRLPPELVDQAINWIYLDSDRWDSYPERTKLIRKPALVCKEWATICRPYIFREIRINKKRGKQFFALLQTAPAIGIVVKLLAFDGRDRHRKRRSLPWLVSVFPNLHKYLPNINDVRIKYADIDIEDTVDWSTSIYPLLETMAYVRNLTFQDMYAPIAIIQDLSCAFPNIDRVMLVECEFNVDDNDRKRTYAGSPAFRELCVDWYGSEWWDGTMSEVDAGPSACLDQFAPFLLSAEPNRSLRSLKLDVCRMHLRPAVSLLDQLGPRLEELVLQVKIDENGESYSKL